jgi:hypothetical protein
VGTFYSSARGQIGGAGPQGQIVQEGTQWVYTPTVPGVYQFFCRVHPSMRGVFWVIPSTAATTVGVAGGDASALDAAMVLRPGRPW